MVEKPDLQYKMFLLNFVVQKIKKTIARFTIQNVPIKFQDFKMSCFKRYDLQYKMFLLN